MVSAQATSELTQDNPVLELHNVSRVFGGTIRAVDTLNMQIFPGEIVSILGPSGCGKTTTMRMIAGLDNPTEGDVRINGKSVLTMPPHTRNIGLVFQTLAIFPHMDIQQNVAFGLRMKGIEQAAIEKKVRDTLEMVRLPFAEFGGRMPSQLSGGQLQRVALARTLATEPALVLFDEPMAALDRRLRDYMAVELRKIQKELNVAAIYVTHDQETASAMSDRIVIMEAGQIVQSGTPECIYETPANRFVAEFLGDVNFLVPKSVSVARDGLREVAIADGHFQITDDGQTDITSRSLMFRPEHVALHAKKSKTATLSGKVSELSFSSGFYKAKIKLSDSQEIMASAVDNTALQDGVGSQVWLSVKPRHAQMLST